MLAVIFCCVATLCLPICVFALMFAVWRRQNLSRRLATAADARHVKRCTPGAKVCVSAHGMRSTGLKGKHLGGDWHGRACWMAREPSAEGPVGPQSRTAEPPLLVSCEVTGLNLLVCHSLTANRSKFQIKDIKAFPSITEKKASIGFFACISRT